MVLWRAKGWNELADLAIWMVANPGWATWGLAGELG